MSRIALRVKRRCLTHAVVGLTLLGGFVTAGLAVGAAAGQATPEAVDAPAVATTSVIEMREVTLPNGRATAFRVNQTSGAPFAIFVRAPKGLIVCGTFDLAALEARGVAAASVKGIKTIDEALATQVDGVTQQARDLGIESEMPVEEALARLM